ncbi:hypothetical protein [Phaeovulum sp. NW3]|uniref:hypothetical protein n=1 Tax=Phaeovulum sp. NW3 TaxID=2934933 RepID=UPI00202146E3|nr:hypothetical protein [Phaeovulum sp. NW3]MCL7466540.1 hypothetical protein [Phaeovulum sp. NW3]
MTLADLPDALASGDRRLFGRAGPGLRDCLGALTGPGGVTARRLRPLVTGLRPGAGAAEARGLARAAAAMLSGRLAELSEARDRTDALLLAAAARALAGEKVHVVTQCEARAKTLGARAAGFLDGLGLGHTALADGADLDTRSAAYARPVVFASLGRLAQDRLRDRVEGAARRTQALGSVRRLSGRAALLPPLMPPRAAALVDDADLVLIERPRPVRFAPENAIALGRVYADQAFAILSSFLRDQHYAIDPVTARIRLTPIGEMRAETFAVLFGGAWNTPAWRNETLLAALAVRDLFTPPGDYRIENGAVVLRRGTGQGGIEPSIPDLIAAKEGLPGGLGIAHLADARRTLAAYDSLGGAGLGLLDYRAELRKGHGLRIWGRATRPARPQHRVFATRSDLVHALGGLLLPPDALIWAPTRADADRMPPSRVRVITGDALFHSDAAPSVVVQAGAATPAWELRLRSSFPQARHFGYVSAADGLFSLPEAGDTAFVRPDLRSYRAAQAAVARQLAAQRLAALQSQGYFDRILGFLGET